MRRILTALVLIPLVVALVLWAPPHLMVAVQLVIALAGVWEFFRLAEAAHIRPIRLPGFLFAIAISASAQIPAFSLGTALGSATATLVTFLLVLMVAAMRPSGNLSDYLGSVAASFFGPVYVALPLALLVWVWRQYDGAFHVLFALVVVWVGDSVAYFIGSALGRHKSSPRISPNKTWEGTTASFAAALLVGLATGRFFWGNDSLAEPVVLAGLLNVAGQLGDLAESALKRSAGVKDSSQIIPGHGGILDRLDALLFAAPILWYYWLWKAS